MRCVYLAVFILFLLPNAAFAEYINSFTSEIEIQKDGSFVVNEQINYLFTEPRRGIFRYIPIEHPQGSSRWYKDRYVEVEVLDVSMDGRYVRYEINEESDETYIKIGDPNVTISGGHMYEITYRVNGGLSYFEGDAAELYWNVTGNGWEVPIGTVEVIVTSPSLFTGERACYRGTLGSNTSCLENSITEDRAYFKVSGLKPREGATIAVAVDERNIERVILEKNQMIIFWTAIVLLWFSGLTYFVYRYKTKHQTGNTIIAHYEPYKDFKPMYTGLLFDGMLEPKDITACIVYLAEQGFLKIKKTTGKVLFFFEVDDYEISLLRDPNETPTRFQREVLKLLFGGISTIGDTVTLSDLKRNISKQKENQTILKELKKDLEQDLKDSGFFQVTIPSHYVFGGAVAVIVTAATLFGFLFGSLITSMIPLVIITILSLIVLAFAYRRRTRKGYEALDHLKGFKEFLSVTEKERYAFHNAPTKSPEQFMEYLPYAIAFGVEKKWAEVFKDITIPDPDWYEGAGTAHFSATNLTTSLGAFSTAFASSSGSSGSSGGGSVGGGGGGGGGGSW